MQLQAALNGSRSPHRHHVVPFEPERLATEARGAVSAGADLIHVHVYDRDGRESLAGRYVDSTLAAIRSSCPDTPLGISMGPAADLTERLSDISSWSVLPDYVAVNFRDPIAGAIVECLCNRDIAIEAGILCVPSALAFVAGGFAESCLRIIIEPLEPGLEEAVLNTVAIEDAIASVTATLPRLLHGTDATAWTMLPEAVARGYDTRIGFEDTLNLPDGRPASSNGELVAKAMEFLAKRRSGA